MSKNEEFTNANNPGYWLLRRLNELMEYTANDPELIERAIKHLTAEIAALAAIRDCVKPRGANPAASPCSLSPRAIEAAAQEETHNRRAEAARKGWAKRKAKT